MYLIDSHSHIYQKDFDNDRDCVVSRARQCGINKILLPNVDLESIPLMQSACDQYPEVCYPMMGLHPTSVNSGFKPQLEYIHKQFEDSRYRYIAVGEIGLDLYWDKSFLREQIIALEEQLNWSIDLQLPVVIHSRDAIPQVVECIRRVGVHQLRGVFHSFGGSEEELQMLIPLENFMIGINGVVTFKNSTLRQHLHLAPLNRIVLETDAPYLAPIPYRGKRNEPSYIIEVANKLAEIYRTDLKEIAKQTTQNVEILFNCR